MVFAAESEVVNVNRIPNVRSKYLLAEYGKVASVSLMNALRQRYDQQGSAYRTGIGHFEKLKEKCIGNASSSFMPIYLIHEPVLQTWFLNQPCIESDPNFWVISITRLLHERFLSASFENQVALYQAGRILPCISEAHCFLRYSKTFVSKKMKDPHPQYFQIVANNLGLWTNSSSSDSSISLPHLDRHNQRFFLNAWGKPQPLESNLNVDRVIRLGDLWDPVRNRILIRKGEHGSRFNFLLLRFEDIDHGLQ